MNNLMSNVSSLKKYHQFTQDIYKNPESIKQIRLNLPNITCIIIFSNNYEIQYYNKFGNVGAAYLIFKHLLAIELSSQPWNDLAEDVLEVLTIWLGAIKNNDVKQKWKFFCKILECLTLLDKKSYILKVKIMEQFMEDLLIFATSNQFNGMQKSCILSFIHGCLTGMNRELKFQYFQKFHEYLVTLAHSIAQCEDYLSQFTIMQVLMRWLPNRHEPIVRAEIAKIWFPYPTFSKTAFHIFLGRPFEKLNADSREFLNAQNASTKSIVSIKCEKLRLDNELLAEDTNQTIWLDLSTLTKTMTLHYKAKVIGNKVQEMFQVMTLNSDNVKVAELKNGLMCIETHKSPSYLYKSNTIMESMKENGNQLLISIQRQYCTKMFHETMTRILDNKYKFINKSFVDYDSKAGACTPNVHNIGQTLERLVFTSPTPSSVCLPILRKNIEAAPNELVMGKIHKMTKIRSLEDLDELLEPQDSESDNENNYINVETVAEIHTSKLNIKNDNNVINNQSGSKLRSEEDLILPDDLLGSSKSHLMDDNIVQQLFRDASVERNVSTRINTEKTNGLSKTSSGHDSIISNTPYYVNTRKGNNKTNDSRDANVVEDFFAQHARQMEDGTIENYPPSLVQCINPSSGTTSRIVDNLVEKLHNDSELNTCYDKQEKSNNIDLQKKPIPELSEKLDFVDGAQTQVNRSKEKKDTTIKKRVTKSRKNKPKISPKKSKFTNKPDTPKVTGKRRILFSPNNIDPQDFDEEFSPRNTSSKEASTFYSELIKERKNLRSSGRPRLKPTKSVSSRESTPKKQKINDMFDKIKSTENSNPDDVHIVEVTNKNAHDIAVYNFSSESDDEYFKTKKTQSVKSKTKGKKKVAFTTKTLKTPSRKKNTTKKTPGAKSTDKILINPLIDEGMRKAVNNEDINVSIIDNIDSEVIVDKTLKPQILKQPEMEMISDNNNKKKSKIKCNIKKTAPNKINKKKSALTPKEKEASPLPLLVVEAVPENDKVKDSTITSNIISDIKRFYHDPTNTNNSVNVTLAECVAPKTNSVEHETVDVQNVHESPLTNRIVNNEYFPPTILIRSSDDVSEKTFATAGAKSHIDGHGDSDQCPPDPQYLNRTESPRSLNLEDLAPATRDYYAKMCNEINEDTPKKNHLSYTNSSDMSKESMSRNNENQLNNFKLPQSRVVLHRMNGIDTFLTGPQITATKTQNVTAKKSAQKKVMETFKTPSTIQTSSPKTNKMQGLMFDTKNLESKISPIKIRNSRSLLLQSETTSIESETVGDKSPVNTRRYHDNVSSRESLKLKCTLNKHLLCFTDKNLLNNDTGRILRSKTSSNNSTKSDNSSQKSAADSQKSPKNTRYFLRSNTNSSCSDNLNLPQLENRIATRKRPPIGGDEFAGKRQKISGKENVNDVTSSSVSKWLESDTCKINDRDAIAQQYNDILMSVLERLDTTLAEINRDTAHRFLKLSVDLQNKIQADKEERFREFMKLEESFDKRNADVWKQFNASFKSTLLDDVNKKKLMVRILKEEVENVRQHIMQKNQ